MHIVIIGGDAAGMSAAMEIVRSDANAQITVLEKGDVYSYGQCGLPYVIDGRVEEAEDLIARPVEAFREKYGINAKIFHEVQHVDVDKQTVSGMDYATQQPFEMSYDKLLVASGARPIIPAEWENNALPGIHTVKSIPQMTALLSDLQNVKHATVIGAGFIGLEVVEALALRGVNVRLIYRGSHLMKELKPTFSEKIHAEAIKQGVELCLQQDVLGFEGEERVTAVRTKTDVLATDLVIVATGVKPNTEFIDVEKLPNGAIIVDKKMATSAANVYAAGDCASHYHRIKKQPDYIALGTTANKQGRIAGKQLAGGATTFEGVVGTTILKFFDLTIGFTGIKTDTSYEMTANHIASYYPTPKPIQVVVYTTEDGLLQGLQAIGEEGVDKRIDVFATALYNEMTLAQLSDLDLSYAPPYNGVWDVLLQVSKRYS